MVDGRLYHIDGVNVLERMRCWTINDSDSLTPFEADHRWRTYRGHDWWRPREVTISRRIYTQQSRTDRYEQLHKDEINLRRRLRRQNAKISGTQTEETIR